ncbi:AHH domain-containing protein, partial [Pseudoalteromonas sp. '520P1 No. 412']
VTESVAVNDNVLSAKVRSTDDVALERVSFAIFKEDKTVIDTSSLITVNSPANVNYNANKDVFSWGYSPATNVELSEWEIDINQLPKGTYYVMFYASNGTESVNTEFVQFEQSVDNSEPANVLSVRLTPEIPLLYQPLTLKVVMNKPALNVSMSVGEAEKITMAHSTNLIAWEYTLDEGLQSLEETSFKLYVNDQSSASYSQSLTAILDPNLPVVKSLYWKPLEPKINEKIEFNIQLKQRTESALQIELPASDEILGLSSVDGVNWSGELSNGLADNKSKLFELKANDKILLKKEIKAYANYWFMQDGIDENYDDGVELRPQEKFVKTYWLTNVGDYNWEQFKLKACDQQGNICEEVITSISAKQGERKRLDVSITADKAEGNYRKYFRLFDSNDVLVTNQLNLEHIWVDYVVKARDIAEEVCKESTSLNCTDEAVFIISESYNEGIKLCEAVTDSNINFKLKNLTVVAHNEIDFNIEKLPNNRWLLQPQFKSSLLTESLNDDVKRFVSELNNVVHYLPEYTLYDPSEGVNPAKFACTAQVKMNLLSKVYESAYKETVSRNNAQVQELEKELQLGDNKFKSNISIGLSAALADELEHINTIMKTRDTLNYAIRRSFSDFFINDAAEIINIDETIMHLDVAVEKLNALKGSMSLTDNDFKNFELLLDELVQQAEIDPEGLWVASTKLNDLVKNKAFKSIFIKGLGLHDIADTELVNSDEFGYLIGFYGGQLITETVHLIKLKNLKNKLVHGMAKSVAKNAAKSIFKAAKVLDRLSNGVEVEGIARLKDSGINKFLALRRVLEGLKSTNDAKINTDREYAFNQSSQKFLTECKLFDQWPTPAIYSDKCHVFNENNRFGRKLSYKYSLLKNNVVPTGGQKNTQRSYIEKVINLPSKSQCQVHHILPKSLFFQNGILKEDTNYQYFAHDQSNLIVLPEKNNNKYCSNNERAALHRGPHRVYNKFVKAVLSEWLAGQSGLKPEKYMYLINTLRVLLSKGNGLFPLEKSHDLPKHENDKIDLKKSRFGRNAKSLVNFLNKYNEHARNYFPSKSNKE